MINGYQFRYNGEIYLIELIGPRTVLLIHDGAYEHWEVNEFWRVIGEVNETQMVR